MIPRRYAPVLFGLILSGLMSLLVSGKGGGREGSAPSAQASKRKKAANRG